MPETTASAQPLPPFSVDRINNVLFPANGQAEQGISRVVAFKILADTSLFLFAFVLSHHSGSKIDFRLRPLLCCDQKASNLDRNTMGPKNP